MTAQIFFLILVAIVLLVVAAKSITITKQSERLVVFRLGKFVGVYPPGLNVVIPLIDRCIKVRIEMIDGWQTLSEQQLLERIGQAVVKDHSPRRGVDSQQDWR